MAPGTRPCPLPRAPILPNISPFKQSRPKRDSPRSSCQAKKRFPAGTKPKSLKVFDASDCEANPTRPCGGSRKKNGASNFKQDATVACNAETGSYGLKVACSTSLSSKWTRIFVRSYCRRRDAFISSLLSLVTNVLGNCSSIFFFCDRASPPR